MGCTSCCGTREWRDLPDAHATGRTLCILSSPACTCAPIVGRLVLFHGKK